MFLLNKYTTWYFNIIASAKEECRQRYTGIYYENHHIIPEKLSGSDDDNNLVLLTAKEHYIVHALLPKMTTGWAHHQMVFAWWGMTNWITGNHQRYNSKLFVYAKRAFIESNKFRLKEYVHSDVGQSNLSKAGKLAGALSVDEQTGAHSLEYKTSGKYLKDKGKAGKLGGRNSVNSPNHATKQKWKCLEPNCDYHLTTPGGLSMHQNATDHKGRLRIK